MRTEVIRPELWGDLERLFGPEGASSGCWCMSLRLAPGDPGYGDYGEPARTRLRALVHANRIHGILAYVGDEAVGWCSFGHRVDFRELDANNTLACDDAEEVWSIGCFWVPSKHRGEGVPAALLERALTEIGALGGRVVEAYPVKLNAPPEILADWSFTGPQHLFEANGFCCAANTMGCLQRVRLSLAPAD